MIAMLLARREEDGERKSEDEGVFHRVWSENEKSESVDSLFRIVVYH
jgi:hypothetical protein